jgi:predicted esterase
MGERTVATLEAIEARHPRSGRPVVTGFSQGAMIVYSLALRHPDRFALFAPVSGVYVRNTAPTPRVTTSTPRVVAFHGTRDPILPIEAGRESVEAMHALGVTVELRRARCLALDRRRAPARSPSRARLRDRASAVMFSRAK